MSVSDRYTSSSPSVWTCPSCGAEDQPYLIHHGDILECPKCYVKDPQPGLGELTDKYIREGLTDEDAFRQAKEDRY